MNCVYIAGRKIVREVEGGWGCSVVIGVTGYSHRLSLHLIVYRGISRSGKA
jgi:hypothetical protein